MSQITLSNSTYAGYFDNEIIAASVLEARSIKNGYVTLHTNVDDKYTVIFADTDVHVADGAATFSDAGSETLSEIKFDLGKFMINREIDYSNLDNFWLASQQPRGRAGDFSAPATLEDALNAHFAAKASVMVGASIWKGSALALADLAGITDATSSSSVTGLIDIMLGNSSVVDLGVGGTYKQTASDISVAANAVVTVASTADYAVGDKVTLRGMSDGANTADNGKTFTIDAILNATTFTCGFDTAAAGGADTGTVTCINKNNVVRALEEAYSSMSDNIRLQPDTAFFVPSRVASAYRIAQAEAAYSPNVYSEDYTLAYLGYPVHEIPECHENVIVTCRVSNLHFATPLASDFNSVMIVDQAETTASRSIRYRLDYAFDVNISGAADITLLS